jgi:hypothetical protein
MPSPRSSRLNKKATGNRQKAEDGMEDELRMAWGFGIQNLKSKIE